MLGSLIQRKRKYDTAAGPSSDPDQQSPKRAKPSTADDLAIEWGVSVETAKAYIDENNAVQQQLETTAKDSLIIHQIMRDIEDLETQKQMLSRFNPKHKSNQTNNTSKPGHGKI